MSKNKLQNAIINILAYGGIIRSSDSLGLKPEYIEQGKNWNAILLVEFPYWKNKNFDKEEFEKASGLVLKVQPKAKLN